MPSKQTERPKRIRVINELGKPQTLPDGRQYHRLMGKGNPLIILGLGPSPSGLAEILKKLPNVGSGAPVFYIECPDFIRQMPPGWKEQIPSSWIPLASLQDLPESADAAPPACTNPFPDEASLLIYTPALRLFPGFWGPIMAKAWRQTNLAHPPADTNTPWVLLPGDENGLLIRELQQAFTDAGLPAYTHSPQSLPESLPEMLREPPALFFSVNMQGLDAYGERFHILRECGVRVAIWFVDNPWHILSGIKSPFWKKASLFVTDCSFISSLREHGAGDVTHLPLAAAPEFFSPERGLRSLETAAEIDENIVFVGRSRFPDKMKFFAGCTVNHTLWERAKQVISEGGRPDFDWWSTWTGTGHFWPGNGVRPAGFGAEESSCLQRISCLQNAAAFEGGLSVFGDAEWKNLLPESVRLHGPVDYYGSLCSIYSRAAAVLNVTSLLLPAGLTQRHFDVWAAGGLLLTDNTPGLSIFPEELTRPIKFMAPAGVHKRANNLLSNSASTAILRDDWRAHILGNHTYSHRIEKILSHIFRKKRFQPLALHLRQV